MENQPKKRGRKPKNQTQLPAFKTEQELHEAITGAIESAGFVRVEDETQNHAEVLDALIPKDSEPLKLSICVIAIPEHVESCKRLAESLGFDVDAIESGINKFPHPDQRVELLVNLTARHDKGGPTRGKKRQALLETAMGEYVCSIDADDTVVHDWLELILKAIESGPDCVGFEVNCRFNGKYYGAIVSNRFEKWSEGLGKSGKYERAPHHLAPIRRIHAMKAGFKPEVNYGEDYFYCLAVNKYLKNEVFIPQEIYFYHK